MKKISVFILLVVVSFTLTGCSKKSTTSSSQTANATATKVSIEDETTYEVTNRVSVTDPALANYLEENNYADTSGDLPTLSAEEAERVGLIAQISKVSKYGLSGTAQIVSSTSIMLKSFSFNGTCLPLLVYLTRQNQPNKPLIKVKEISAPVSNTSVTVEIPSNTSLTTFDSIGFYCSEDTTSPISTAYFAK